MATASERQQNNQLGTNTTQGIPKGHAAYDVVFGYRRTFTDGSAHALDAQYDLFVVFLHFLDLG